MGIPRVTPRPPQPREVGPGDRTPPQRASELASVRRRDSNIPDEVFRYAMIACGLSVAVLLALIFYELVAHSTPSLHRFGWKFFVESSWDPVSNNFGALPFIYLRK